ncbi:MAG: hemolysin III family protein [Comamonadaceae bacterium]|nr:MAG: hemolysin III family protein [Comamonadaceae bacterium]
MSDVQKRSRRCQSGRWPPGERFNTWSHLSALAGGAIASIWLVLSAIATGQAQKIVGAVVFGSAVVTLFLASTLFHSSTGARKLIWQRADHACIYVLIAATHTPFALAPQPNAWAWTWTGPWALLATVWAFAIWGALKAMRSDAAPGLALYVGLGWLGLLAAVPAALRNGTHTMAWLIAGGLCYSVGTLFYRRYARLRHSHGMWHCFVVAGAASHAVAVSLLVR